MICVPVRTSDVDATILATVIITPHHYPTDFLLWKGLGVFAILFP
jgi:hypothetical protein